MDKIIKESLDKIKYIESSQLNEGVVSALAGKIGNKIFPGLSVAQYGTEAYDLFKAGKTVDAVIAAAKAVGYAIPATAGVLGTYDLLMMLWDNKDELIKLAQDFTTTDTESPTQSYKNTNKGEEYDPDIAALQQELVEKGEKIEINGIASDTLYSLAVKHGYIQE